MSGKERLLCAGHPHYLVRRSSHNQPIFLNEADFTSCRGDIRELSTEYDLALHAYCLLPHEVHVVTTPHGDPNTLSQFMKALSCRATLRRKNLHGGDSVWEPRYRSSPIELSQWLLTCMCYVERLPVIHELARSAYHYHRSSYRARLGKTGHYWLTDPEEYVSLGSTRKERADAYRMYMSTGLDPNDEKIIEAALKQRDKPIGSDRFIQEMYRRHGKKPTD